MEIFYSIPRQQYPLETYFILNKVGLMANVFKRNFSMFVKTSIQ
jgi:hypothetical protein